MSRIQNCRKKNLRLESLEDRTLLAVCAGAAALMTPQTTSAEWVVTTAQDTVDASDGVLSLREAIGSASDGDVITFDASLSGKTITLSAGQLEVSKAVTIDASGLSGGITVNANGAGRVLYVTGGSAETPIELINLTLKDGALTDSLGAGIYNDNGFVNLTNCTVTGMSCTASEGSTTADAAGIFNNGGTMVITGSAISNNTAAFDAGGLHNNGGTVTVADTIFSGNHAGGLGGAAYSSRGSISFTDCVFTENSAGDDGGAFCQSRGTDTFTGCTFTGNSAADDGGVIFVKAGETLTVESSVFNGNSCHGAGAAIFIQGTVTITNTLIYGNHSDNYGGAFYVAAGSNGAMSNTTLANNTAGRFGGAIYYAEDFNCYNSIIVGNSASESGDDIYVQRGTTGGFYTLSGYTNWEVSASPYAYDASKPLFTDAAGSDYTLCENSFAINLGNDGYVSAETDLAGNPRIVGSSVDLGAYEYQTSQEATTYIVTTLGDTVNASDGLLSLREALAAASDEDMIIFDSSLAGGTITLSRGQLEIRNSVTISASDLDGGITIDANKKNRVFYVAGTKVGLSGLTIKGGKVSDNGAGIYNDATVLTITDTEFIGNAANGSGGAVYSTGPLSMTGGVFSGNTAAIGGAVCNEGSLSIANVAFTGNSASDDGGAVAATGSTFSFSGCTFTENSSVDDGGALYFDLVRGEIANSVFSSNSASDDGGAIFGTISTDKLWMSDSILSDNYCAGAGGAIFLTGSARITNSLMHSNRTDHYGGAIYIAPSNKPSVVINTTIANNTADQGGGIYYAEDLSLYNSILAGNTASTSGDDIYVRRGTTGGFYTLSGYTNWEVSNAPYTYNPDKPLFADSDSGDYTLADDSQAINLGNNDYVSAETDLAGNPRIVGGIVDLGAYESQATHEPVTYIVTTLNDTTDPNDGLLSLREALAEAAGEDTVMFDSSLAGGTITLAQGQLEITKSVTVTASDLEDGITIDAGGASRAVNITGMKVTLENLTVTGGNAADNGAGICNNGGSLILNNIGFADNSATGSGGALYSTGSVNLTDCDFTNNTAGISGGAILSTGGITVTNGVFSGNSAGDDGGAIATTGSFTITDSSFTGNSTVDDGGAIYFESISGMIDTVVFTSNSAQDDGGVIFGKTLGDALVVKYSIFNDNYCHGAGAAMNVTGVFRISNSLICNNRCDNYGGGIYVGASNKTSQMTNTTVAENTAKLGGGIYYAEDLNCYNSIIARNTASSAGDDIYVQRGTTGGFYTLSGYTDWEVSDTPYVYDPSKPLFTDAAGGDFTLPEDSQAVDIGNNDYAPSSYDLRHFDRIYNGTIDLGAYEYQPQAIEQLETPTITTGTLWAYVSYGANRHLIVWESVENASGYELAYSADGNNWVSIETAETSEIITGLSYGDDMTYRVRALGDGTNYTDSDWSVSKTFNVCPMDINGDSDISGGDRTLLASAWLAEEGEEEYRYYSDINGDGDIGGADRAFLANNWLDEAGDDDLLYPPAKLADTFFADFASAGIDVNLDVF